MTGLVRSCVGLLSLLYSLVFLAEAFSQTSLQSDLSSVQGSPEPSVQISADSIQFNHLSEEYHAVGNVEVTRGLVRLNAEEVFLQKLTGKVRAIGNVHLKDEHGDIWADQLKINVNTEAGVVINGEIFGKEQNSFVTGRRLQRFSETHYRIKDGSFTNCDAKDGEIPAWRFTFQDLDLDYEDSLSGKRVWFNINDVPLIPLPSFQYPLGAKRKTGLLIPNVGYNNKFGLTYQQGFFWAMTPSQDVTLVPRVLTKRGYGGDLKYRYVWSRQTKGKWLLNGLVDTKENQKRAQIRGSHVQQFTPKLSLRLNMNYSTDRKYLRDLSNSGVQRALPSQESNLSVVQRLDTGSFYLWGQYLQPLNVGSERTFQRLPEIGHRFFDYGLFESPFAFTVDTTYVHFWREEGFDVNRVDFVPGMSVEGLHLGHVIGVRPQAKFRTVWYSRGNTTKKRQHRETVWLGGEVFSQVSRRFSVNGGGRFRHSIKPHVMYEYVPETDQTKLVMIDAVDDLIKKNLVTYSLQNRFSESGRGSSTSTSLDVILAQSYHLGQLPPDASPLSNIWGLGDFHLPTIDSSLLSAFDLTVDAFFNHEEKHFTQINTDARIIGNNHWYVTVGQRYSRAGLQTRRGDIWNPVSFNEVLLQSNKIFFLTAGGGVRLPWGVTVGSRWYRDLETKKTAELDVVALYQNPCRCFSLGLSYVKLPDRKQFDFLITLTGLWGSQGTATQLMKAILGPIMGAGRGVPWDYR